MIYTVHLHATEKASREAFYEVVKDITDVVFNISNRYYDIENTRHLYISWNSNEYEPLRGIKISKIVIEEPIDIDDLIYLMPQMYWKKIND